MAKIILEANNALYDMAVLLYAASGFLKLMRPAYKGGILPKIAKLSLFLFILDGIPRMLFYHSLEWGEAVGRGQAGELLGHILLLGILAAIGTYAWIKGKTAKEVFGQAGCGPS